MEEKQLKFRFDPVMFDKFYNWLYEKDKDLWLDIYNPLVGTYDGTFIDLPQATQASGINNVIDAVRYAAQRSVIFDLKSDKVEEGIKYFNGLINENCLRQIEEVLGESDDPDDDGYNTELEELNDADLLWHESCFEDRRPFICCGALKDVSPRNIMFLLDLFQIQSARKDWEMLDTIPGTDLKIERDPIMILYNLIANKDKSFSFLSPLMYADFCKIYGLDPEALKRCQGYRSFGPFEEYCNKHNVSVYSCSDETEENNLVFRKVSDWYKQMQKKHKDHLMCLCLEKYKDEKKKASESKKEVRKESLIAEEHVELRETPDEAVATNIDVVDNAIQVMKKDNSNRQKIIQSLNEKIEKLKKEIDRMEKEKNVHQTVIDEHNNDIVRLSEYGKAINSICEKYF